MGTKLKLAALLSSLAASTTLFAQNTAPAQSPAAKAPVRATQIAQGQAAPAATTGAQAAGAAAAEAGAAAAAGAGLGIPAAVAAGLTAVGAASTDDNGALTAPTHH